MKHILALGLLMLAVAAGCGDEKKGPSNPNCTETGTACADGADACCTGFCDDLSGQCARVPGTCVMADGDCSVGPDCCSLSCIDFKCSGDQCVSDNESCDQDGECCSGVCSDGNCAPLNASCKTAGNACGANAECCAGLCNDADGDGTTTCNNAPSFCTISGDACVTDGECCGGTCQKADGATLGTCALVPSSGATGCESLGEVCGNGADYDPATQELPTCGGECCSRACFPYGPTGVLICQPPSGCRPTGELCYEDSDCCGGPGQFDHDPANVMCRKEPGYAVGRCDNGNACAPAGAICRLQDVQCNATATCCAGNAIQDGVCQQDALGIPRCGISQCAPNDPTCGENCDPATKVGMSCATSADCCGNPCTSIPGAEGFICAAACMMTGSTCTTNTDCCSGLPCVIPAGSTQGTCGNNMGCADYGQACDANNPCCNDLPCSNGICQGIIL